MTNSFNPEKDTPANRIASLKAAQIEHWGLSPQERAATRVAVWVEGGYVFCSGSCSGQPPEGEVEM